MLVPSFIIISRLFAYELLNNSNLKFLWWSYYRNFCEIDETFLQPVIEALQLIANINVESHVKCRVNDVTIIARVICSSCFAGFVVNDVLKEVWSLLRIYLKH